MCSAFITNLFAYPELPPTSSANPSSPSPTLAQFIAYSLHCTHLHQSVTFSALFLLNHLNDRFKQPSSVYLSVYDRLQGHLRRHVFQQVLSKEELEVFQAELKEYHSYRSLKSTLSIITSRLGLSFLSRDSAFFVTCTTPVLYYSSSQN